MPKSRAGGNAALPDNAPGYARLQAAVDRAVNPLQAVPALPASAASVSGSLYRFDENPVGWQDMRFAFAPGASTAQIVLNGSSPLDMGLDNLYRQTDSPLLGPVLLRAHWEDANTFVAEYPYGFSRPPKLDELGETKLRFAFRSGPRCWRERFPVRICPMPAAPILDGVDWKSVVSM